MNFERAIRKQRKRRRQHVRNKLRGSGEQPRLCVVRSHKHIYCQLVDDSIAKTVVSVSSRDKDLGMKYGGNKESAQAIGKAIAERAIAAGIKNVRFDRGHYKYHGRVAALADAAREAGLVF